MTRNLILASMLAMPAIALAQVSPVGPFTGDHSDGFETTPVGVFQPSYDVFDATAVVISTGGSMHVTGGWGFLCSIGPFEGSRLAGSAGGFVRYEFNDDAGSFGGYFGTNADVSGPDAIARFFDAAGNQIADAVIEIAPDCGWTWNGWEFSTGVAAIEVEGAVFGGAFVMMDGMEVTYGAGGGCRVDLDGDGVLTIFDFLAFQNLFDSGDLTADFDGDGALTIFDFLAFQNEFDEGCE